MIVESEIICRVTNREKARTAKLGKQWCRCDMARIGQVGKYQVCGSRLNRKKIITGQLNDT